MEGTVLNTESRSTYVELSARQPIKNNLTSSCGANKKLVSFNMSQGPQSIQNIDDETSNKRLRDPCHRQQDKLQ
jgi:hypothetical protein